MPPRHTIPVIPANAPYRPPDVHQEIAYAIKGVAAGVADAGQQALVMRWIINVLCGTYDWSYRPSENDRDTNIALGKQFCGQQLVRVINMAPEALKNLPKLHPPSPEDAEQA